MLDSNFRYNVTMKDGIPECTSKQTVKKVVLYNKQVWEACRDLMLAWQDATLPHPNFNDCVDEITKDMNTGGIGKKKAQPFSIVVQKVCCSTK